MTSLPETNIPTGVSGQPAASLPNNDAQTVFGRPSQRRRDSAGVISGAIDVLVDGSGRLGLLTYRVPLGMPVRPGDAVGVPFGVRTRNGLVVSAALEPSKATKDILTVFGTRADPSDVLLAHSIAKYHFVPVTQVLTRLSPRSGRGAVPAVEKIVQLTHAAKDTILPDAEGKTRRLLLVDPTLNMALTAAAEAGRLAEGGQVLVICPSVDAVTRVLSFIEKGAVRLDAASLPGDWKGFCEGQVKIAVGTRSSVLYAAADLAGIVVMDSDSSALIEPRQPCTNARDIASARSRLRNTCLTLISAAPTASDVWICGGTVSRVRAENGWPKILVADRSADSEDPLIPEYLRTIIRKGVKEGITPVVVASRAESVRRCSGCGTPIPCDQGCENASLCRHKQTTPCPVCHAVVGVRVSGWDPTRLAALLGTSVKTVNSKQLSQIKNAGLVILFDIDASLSVPSWASETYAVHLVVAAARAAGSNGKVLLVTGDVRQRLIRDLVARSDVLASAKRGLATAKAGGLPPYGRIVTINVKHKTMPDTENWPGKVLGPSKQGPEEFQIVVRIPTNELGKLTPYIAQLRKRSKIKVVVQ